MPRLEQAYLEKAVDVVREGSQPQFMNMDAAMTRSLVRFASRGVTLDEARTCPVIFGCVGTGMAGKGSYVTFEGQPNLAKLVELTLNDGYPHTKKQVSANKVKVEGSETFEASIRLFLKHMDYGYDAQCKISNLGNSTREMLVPTFSARACSKVASKRAL